MAGSHHEPKPTGTDLRLQRIPRNEFRIKVVIIGELFREESPGDQGGRWDVRCRHDASVDRRPQRTSKVRLGGNDGAAMLILMLLLSGRVRVEDVPGSHHARTLAAAMTRG